MRGSRDQLGRRRSIGRSTAGGRRVEERSATAAGFLMLMGRRTRAGVERPTGLTRGRETNMLLQGSRDGRRSVTCQPKGVLQTMPRPPCDDPPSCNNRQDFTCLLSGLIGRTSILLIVYPDLAEGGCEEPFWRSTSTRLRPVALAPPNHDLASRPPPAVQPARLLFLHSDRLYYVHPRRALPRCLPLSNATSARQQGPARPPHGTTTEGESVEGCSDH